MAEASAREARRAALRGDFGSARRWAETAIRFRPRSPAYQERVRLVRLAADAELRNAGEPLFPDTVGPVSSKKWWQHDLLGTVRGWRGLATVPEPVMLAEVKREALAGVYAVGTYMPRRGQGEDKAPLFTRYIRELKPGGRTIPLAAVLLWQGITNETDWSEEIDVVVPMPSALRSYEERGFELTEELGEGLAMRMCLPYIDALERTVETTRTHAAGGYRDRAAELAETLYVKKGRSALLREAEAVLVVDDVVTTGASFEGCARKLTASYPGLRVYGAALAYTETPRRRAQAEAERAEARRRP
jgi:predicted amidophosphoribosyltransferase